MGTLIEEFIENSNIGKMSLSNIPPLIRMMLREGPEGPVNSSTILYVKANEAVVFWDVVLPLAEAFKNGNASNPIVSFHRPTNAFIKKDDVPILEIDAGKLTFGEFKKFLRLEAPSFICGLLQDENRKIVIYLHGIQNAKEKLAPLMTWFLEWRNVRNKKIIISGIFEEEALKNVICPGVTSQCSVWGIDQ